MMDLTISLEQALLQRDKGVLFVDARSPAEFAEATIPGALNVPVLDNDERAEVGTLYKQQGKQAARQRGVELVAPKIPAMLAKVSQERPEDVPLVVVFCWRGGMRSRALAQFLDLAGIPARQLVGGHKMFRQQVLQFFEDAQWGRLLVLRGLTGVGKTKVLQELAAEGEPVIDLEGLANHRGSAFGSLGLPSQPSQKMFEALLWDELRKVPSGQYVLVEGESRHIGRVLLPPKVYRAMQCETSIWLNAPMACRVRNILHDYPAIDNLKEQFVKPLQALKERLGKQVLDEFLSLLEAGEWETLTRELMEQYYDPLYRHTLPEQRIEVEIEPLPQGLAEVRRAVEQILGAKTAPV